jgi:hypothetical protein
MTRTEALAKYAAAYAAYRMAQDVPPYNLQVETQYATMDLANMTKRDTEANALYIIEDETSILIAALNKRAAA